MASAVAEREGKSYWGMSARRCDSCRSAPALLFCRADSAFLCGSCDAQVHRANKLASRHERVWMCEVCEQAPAAVTCKADAAALCVSCDADIHSANPLARRHDRIPVQPFDFLPTPTPTTKSKALEQRQKHHQQDDDDEEVNDNGDNNVDEDDDPPSMTDGPPPTNLFSDVDPYINLDYAESMDAGSFNHTADSVVPNHGSLIQPADHAPAAMFFAAPPQDHDAYDVDFTQSKDQPHNFMYPPLSNSQSVSSSEVGVVPDGSATVEMSDHYVTGVPVNPTSINMSQPEPAVAAVGMDREARVMRYREKRKNRKFEKTIRYASRKAYAEKRPRIKGRFVKRTARDETTGYSVVPTF